VWPPPLLEVFLFSPPSAAHPQPSRRARGIFPPPPFFQYVSFPGPFSACDTILTPQSQFYRFPVFFSGHLQRLLFFCPQTLSPPNPPPSPPFGQPSAFFFLWFTVPPHRWWRLCCFFLSIITACSFAPAHVRGRRVGVGVSQSVWLGCCLRRFFPCPRPFFIRFLTFFRFFCSSFFVPLPTPDPPLSTLFYIPHVWLDSPPPFADTHPP